MITSESVASEDLSGGHCEVKWLGASELAC